MVKLKKLNIKSPFTPKLKSRFPFLRNQHVRFGITIGFILTISAGLIFTTNLWLNQRTYNLGKAGSLLSTAKQSMADKIKYDSEKQTYTFSNNEGSFTTGSAQTGSGKISIVANQDASKGLSVTDATNNINFSLTPKYKLDNGKQNSNRIIYPLSNGTGWTVYTMQGTGAKEDIILKEAASDTATFEYSLNLSDNSLEARIESDGSIGVYGNTLLSGNVSTSTESDAALLLKAKQNAAKDTLIFTIPKPVVIETGKEKTGVSASYLLQGSDLKINVFGLKNAHYPLSIDPSIYVVTAQQFMNGNNETNVNFDVTDKLIEKGSTTGARFDTWDNTTNLPTSIWGASTVAAGGYLYSVGGTSFSGQVYNTQGSDTFVVPSGITSITAKMWSGGGGGGAGGSAAAGGAGGGSGYVVGTFSVTPGESLTIYVGGGGGAGARNTAGGGGGGGGYSSIYRGSTLLALVAGGGGGGGGRATASHKGGAGGAGGGTSGVNGANAGGTGTVTGGRGGTPTAGGIAGTGGRNNGTTGTSLNGGLGANGSSTIAGADGGANNGGLATGGDGGSVTTTAYAGGGGGGSGYFGGGGGSGSTGTTITTGGSGGGSGSSYTITGATSVTNTAGSGITPGNPSDTYRNGAGNGGTAGSIAGVGTAGANGLVAITYGTGGTTVSQSVSWAKFNTSTGTVDSANPGSGTCSGWCTTAAYNLPSARTNFSLVTYNGFLYAIGGVDSNGVRQNTVYVAKIGANGEPQLWHPNNSDKSTWVYWYQDANLNSIRSDSSVVAYNNRMYLMGGRSTSGPVSTVEIANINPTGTLGSWTASTSLPSNLYGHGAQVYNDRLYIIGGAASIGGAPSNSVYYIKINSNGSLNNWIQTTSFSTGRLTNGGNFSTVWGAYIYISGGCSAVNVSGYCTTVQSDTQVASINADGSIDVWNNVGGVSSQRMGFSMIAWRDKIYEIGGCSAQNATSGDCSSSMLDTIIYGSINQDGDASTVDQSVANGTAPCSGTDPTSCNLPGTAYIGNMLSATIITNGYLYIIGGCTNNTCSTTTGNVAYVAISSTGTMTKPATCPSGTYRGNTWCVDTTNVITGGIAASSPVVFGNRIYLVGGLNGNSNTNSIARATLNSDGSISAWTIQTMSGVGASSQSYLYAYARANPNDAANNPGNLYIFGGCANSSAAGCTSYGTGTYKCNIQSIGAIAGCSTNNQLQVGVVPGDTQAGLGIMSGTVYANYIYLIGGVTPNLVDLATIRYAKFDNNNNIVAASGSTWIESPNIMQVGRRRASAFGYNGYIYVVGGYDATAGVLADIEYIKVNVSDGSLGTDTVGFQVSAVTINQRWGLSVSVSNSFAYVIGGCTTGTSPGGCTVRTDVIQTFQIYNNDSGAPAGFSAAANTYTTNPNRIGASSTILNGYIYVAGGCISTTDCTAATNDVSYAAIDANGNIGTWSSTTAALPHDLTGGELEAVGGSLYYIGGEKIEETACSPTGESRFEKYDSINGALVSDLYGSAAFPNSPSSTQTLTYTTLSGPSGLGDNFGGRLSAIICAPQTGNYTFWIASDDSSELKLSTDSSPGNASVIASVNGWTNVNTWNTYPSQQSVTIPLVAGKAYYMEANYKQGGGGDHVEVGWQLPDATLERPIASSRYMLPTTGQSKFERYDGISGTLISDLYSSAAFPNSPSSTQTLNYSNLSGPSDIGDNLGGRLSASLRAPQTGNYTFWISSDDSSELRLSTDSSPENASVIASVNGWTNVDTWNTYPSQQSVTISLVAGQTYYIEANYKEGTGGDHIAVGWQLPDATLERPIASSRYMLPTTATSTPQSAIYYATPTTGNIATWTTATNSIPNTRTNFSSAVWNNRIYVVGGEGSGTGCASSVCNTVYVSPQLNSGGNITSAWSTSSTPFNIARSGTSTVAYANNLYIFGGYDGANYLSDSQYSQINTTDGLVGNWTFSANLPRAVSQADAFAANGYIYLMGGRSNATTCTPSTLIAPVSANTTIASGNNPTGVGEWFETNRRYTGNRYGATAEYYDGKAYVIGGACGAALNYASPAVQQTTLLSQPQVAKYSIMIDTDSDVFPSSWLLNGIDNSIGAKWQLKYRSMTNTTTSCASPAMTTWGSETVFGNVTLGLPGIYTPKDSSGVTTNCARFYYFNITVDSSQAFGYPDDVTRGPTITDLTLQFTADPSKRLMHGRTFTGGLQQPIDTPYYAL